ncbi:glycosyltransferase involved in cell wall biosynthesis [Paraburkholderia sp. RAU2J]|uniref:glycosyltransferase family 4 protein n=1 Tax=Paraburkholderia sp. RAU2J TaxID=1938810 RepID=UPI000F259C8C|nr:glycosyltransferase [Paraburkholderia sp. RAU2J]RKT21665.1 glycosyltransferase involved in cell wall biosynthesis [Paraburkholderia sp. RAU2J]
MNPLKKANKEFIGLDYEAAYQSYQAAIKAMPELAHIINFNIELMRRRGFSPQTVVTKAEKAQTYVSPSAQRKLPITVLIITWDVGHNCLGRSYMLAEVVERIARHSLLVGFQFPKYGSNVWEPVRKGRLPVISLPGSNLPEFHQSLERISTSIKPDIVIACKPRLPSIALGMMIKEKWGCPLIIDVDDHELSFFKNQGELSADDLLSLPAAEIGNVTEPYAEIWTRYTQSLCKAADEILVSNVALQRVFGGTIVPHVRDETRFDPSQYNKLEIRKRHGIPTDAKVVMFFGTPRVHKGIDVLAKALSKVADPHFRLVLVGDATDKSVYAKLDQLAEGRIIYLPNQPFNAVPEILAMADIVCLPQDEGHAISKFQLPAKAIDAVAMGIPLLVSKTQPLMQLVDDRVAELVRLEDIPTALERLAGKAETVQAWQDEVRERFLRRYSYAAAADQLRQLFQRTLSRDRSDSMPSKSGFDLVMRHAVGKLPVLALEHQRSGVDIVLFWKQNDTNLYGRRHDMVIKYLASRPDVRKVVIFDAPISEFDLIQRQQSRSEATQHRWIYVGTYEKLLGKFDSQKLSFNVFVYPPGKFRSIESDTSKPKLDDEYFAYVSDVLKRENVTVDKSIFWIYPRNYSAPSLINHFNPKKVVVDVVDDHRAWPGISAAEYQRLTENYRATLAKADMAFVNCEPMIDAMKPFFPSIRLVPNGCDADPPKVEPKDNEEFEAFKLWKGKTIGFVGNLEKKIDIDLLEKIAVRFPDFQLVLIGSTHSNPDVLRLKGYSNVRLPGVVPYEEVGAWVSRFDVGIIPHLNLEMTQHMNPLKLYVYLSWKIPVISTEIFNVDRNATSVRIAGSHEEFLCHISDVLAEEIGADEEMLQFALQNSWHVRFEKHVNELLGVCC